MTAMPLSSVPANANDTLVDRLTALRALQKKVLWLSTWMIHNANHIRPSRDGLKVGGHQASSASSATMLSALYFDVLNPLDRVAVKPHASPVFHAIQYLLGNQTREKSRGFAGSAGRSPIRLGRRIRTTSISRPAQLGSARRTPSSPPLSRTTCISRGSFLRISARAA